LDAKVTITLEVEAEISSGAPEDTVRRFTENCRRLKLKTLDFEKS
jgi:hypothetical protein